MRKEKGLTLIALIVTIIVMIILAGIAISAITGKSGITNQARESKNKSERQEIIESAKSQISDTVVENVGTDITRSQLKEILDKYFENVPDDYTLDTELTTKSEYGNYVIKVSEIYDRTTIFADNGEDSSETTPANTSSTNGGSSDNSGSNNSSTNNSNNSGTNSSTQNTSSTNSNGKNSASTENSESTGTDNSNVNEDPTNNTSREPEEIDVTGVKLDNKSVILDLNGKNTIQLNATPIPNNANKNTKMKWTSKKKTVATVTQDGMVTGKAVGNSTIMAASKNGKSAECLVVCQAKITGITVNPVTAVIQIGETTQLTATITPNTVTEKITWKSSNTDVAKVNRNGLVTGVAKGKAIITAQNPAGTIKATCTVTVGNATLMVASRVTDNYLRSNVAKDKIESIKFLKGQVPTSGIIEQFDASEAEDSSIIGYYTDEDSNDMYELTFVSENNIEANQNSSNLFYFLSSVKEIAFDNFDTSQVTDMRRMFYYCRSLTSIDVSKFDTSKVTNLREMFYYCSSLTSLDVSKFDTSKVTDMDYMFYYCSSLTSLDVSKFDTSKVTDMGYMFYYCRSLTSLDVSKFDTSQVTDVDDMFDHCSSLTSLDVSKFDTSQVTNMKAMFGSCSSLTSLDVSNFNTSQVTKMIHMFSGCGSLTSLDVSKFDTSQITDMDGMFFDCRSLTSLDVSNFNTSKVTNMSWMFNGCRSLTSLDVSKFDTSQVTDVDDMFDHCSSLTSLDVSKFDTSQVTNMKAMFGSCSSLTSLDVSNFNTSQVTKMIHMFSGCGSLTSLDVSKFDTSQITDMDGMFFDCRSLTSLDVSNFNTSKVTNMNSMFNDCRSLTSLDVSKFDTSKVTNMSYMFNDCKSLTSLDVSKFDTSKVTNMSYMFGYCKSLTSLEVSKFDTSKVTDMGYMFYYCSSLTSLDISNFNTSQVTKMIHMFGNCSSLRSIYVSEYNETTGNGWTTKNVTNSYNMFTEATRLVGGNGTKFNSSYIDATYARIDKKGEPGYLTDIGQASKTESYVGYYADVDGDGTVDGIIFADLLHGKTGQWGNSNGTYTIPTIESTKVKSYKISQEDYTNQLGGTSKILTPSGDGNDRFYVMALTDIGTGTYAFGCLMSGTTTTFESGKTNTQTLIGKADLNSSLKEQIQPKVNKGWFIPSKEEWSAFGEELGITEINYRAKGLNHWYWSSSQNNDTSLNAWDASFYYGFMNLCNSNYIGNTNYVRMGTTF